MKDKYTNQSTTTLSQHIVAFDYGLRYIGSAVGNIETALSQPLQTITCKAGKADWRAIDKIFRTWQPCRFVVGYPDPDSPPELLEKLDLFISQLYTRFNLPIDKSSETLSSVEAYHRLKSQRAERKIGKITRSDINKTAAALILESWFEMQRTTTIE